MTLEPITCPNCGSNRIDTARRVCEFCGTKFKIADHELGILRVEHYTAPTRVLGIETIVPNEMHEYAPDNVIPYAKREIAERLADKLLQGELIEFTSEMDLKRCQQIISARLRVLDPKYRF